MRAGRFEEQYLMPDYFSRPDVLKVVVQFDQGNIEQCAKFLIDIRARVNAQSAEAMFNDYLIIVTADSTVESIVAAHKARRTPASVS